MAAPTGYATVNPFIVTQDVTSYIDFLGEVFGAVEHTEARTRDDDGPLLHAEVRIGDGSILFVEPKPGWPVMPSALQIYVEDVQATLTRAEGRGAEVITRPTEFFGTQFSRIIDPWGNGWWVYSTDEPTTGSSERSDPVLPEEGSPQEEADELWEKTPELTYIHSTMHTMFDRLKDGQLRRGR